MLSLERKEGQKIVINGNITIYVKIAQNGRVKLAFDAPKDVIIDREEIHLKRIENPIYFKED